jgi:ATP-binding cassette subfamily F protein 3
VTADAPAAAIRCPGVAPRRGPAVRCRGLSIGHGDRVVAQDIDLEIVHGSRTAIVGDNGQGKTTFLRTVVGSLPPLAGDVKWGHGCELGIYAQHVYTSLPPEQTVLGYLERTAAVGTKSQRILDVAGAMLFRGKAVEKRIEVLSGGERARLCMAGLLLGSSNVLILDEPGNHLDVETVDALARALVDYAGTVIFTSHDRSFVRAVATSVIEVKDGRVVHYSGSYEHYLAAMNREIDAEEEATGRAKPAKKPSRPGAAAKEKATSGRSDRDLRREIGNLERTIARLDADKKRVNEALLATSDVEAAVKLHAELTEVTTKLTNAEESWLALQEQLAAAEPA